MSANTDWLKYTTQDYNVEIKLLDPRSFKLADVNSEGADAGDIHTYPPQGDPRLPLAGALEGIHDARSIGGISGSVSGGGWATTLMLQDVRADLPDFVGVEIWLKTWHGNVPGVIGAAGIADRALIFRGYAQQITTNRKFPSTQISFNLSTSNQFTQSSSFSRGIDWAPGLAHAGPVSMHAIMDHLVRYHTNIGSNSEFGIYVDDHTLERFTLAQGSLHSMLQGCLMNQIEGWVYFDREDNLQIRVHPTLAPQSWADELNNPKIDFDDDMVMEWNIGEEHPYQVASVELRATKSDLTDLTVIRYTIAGEGRGSRDSVTGLRFDEEAPLNRLAELYLAHKNRRYKENVQVTVPLNIVADIGSIVTCTTRDDFRGINWTRKPFVVMAVSYNLDTDRRQFTSVLTLDEVVRV